MRVIALRLPDRIQLWYTKVETSKRLLDRIRTVLDYATVSEYRTGTNPATWRGFLDTQLPYPTWARTRDLRINSLPYYCPQRS